MPRVTCHLRYEINPSELDAFEHFAKRWIALVDAAYEEYRQGFGRGPDFLAADRIREESGCVVRYERTFLRPVLEGDLNA